MFIYITLHYSKAMGGNPWQSVSVFALSGDYILPGLWKRSIAFRTCPKFPQKKRGARNKLDKRGDGFMARGCAFLFSLDTHTMGIRAK